MSDGKALAEFMLKIRNATIEECAKVCEAYATAHPMKPLKIVVTAQQCAEAIRGLKSREMAGS